MKHTLILFSGQNDSIESVVNFLNQNELIQVNLLYINNVGFRNGNEIPFDSAYELFKKTQRINNLYVIDGLSWQKKLIQAFNKNQRSEPALVSDCCLICQFTLHSLYVYAANKLNFNILLPRQDLFPNNFMEIINSPYKNCKKDIQKYVHPDMQIQINIQRAGSSRKCQMAYFHDYKFQYIEEINKINWFNECKIFENCNEIIKRVEFSELQGV